MRRILVDPSALEQTAVLFDQAAAGLEALGRRAAQSPAETDWVSRSIGVVEGRMAVAGRLGADLAAEAFGLGQELRQVAERFRAANAWRPGWGAASAGATATAGVAAAATAAPIPTATAEQVSRANEGVVTDPLGALYSRFPGWEAILSHVVKAEGMRAPNAAHGAVVWESDEGLVSDRQWLNFGYISFAMPRGTGDEVLRNIFSSPTEVEAFKAIAMKHLQERYPDELPSTHTHLLYRATPHIAPLSAAEQAEQLIALVRTGEEKAIADWFFKYGNEPAVDRGVATGHLRPEWGAVMQEFLARPASVEAQLAMIDQEYLTPAANSARTFGLRSEMALAWFTDQHVQSGSPTDLMKAMLTSEAPSDPQLRSHWERYQSGKELERLQVLTELSGSLGPDVRRRREAVLANEALSWAPFAP